MQYKPTMQENCQCNTTYNTRKLPMQYKLTMQDNCQCNPTYDARQPTKPYNLQWTIKYNWQCKTMNIVCKTADNAIQINNAVHWQCNTTDNAIQPTMQYKPTMEENCKCNTTYNAIQPRMEKNNLQCNIYYYVKQWTMEDNLPCKTTYHARQPTMQYKWTMQYNLHWKKQQPTMQYNLLCNYEQCMQHKWQCYTTLNAIQMNNEIQMNYAIQWTMQYNRQCNSTNNAILDKKWVGTF